MRRGDSPPVAASAGIRPGFEQCAWPLPVALAVLAATVALLVGASLVRNAGHFVYALDDPYIHMAMAQNLVRHGVWGVTRYGFSSTSSSPLWTLLLALVYRLFGVSHIAPLVLNGLFAALTAGLAFLVLRGRLPPWAVLLSVVATLVLTNLAALVLAGMDTLLHAFLTVLVAALAARFLGDWRTSRALQAALLVSALLLTATRYEGLFLVLSLSILCACRRRGLFALGLVVAGAVPPLAFGFWWLSRGWFFVPNSVLLLGAAANKTAILLIRDLLAGTRPLSTQALGELVPGLFFIRAVHRPHILLLVLFAVATLPYRRGRFWTPAAVLNLLFLAAAVAHLQFVYWSTFYRHEAYLLALGTLAATVAAGERVAWAQAHWRDPLRVSAAAAMLSLLLLAGAFTGVRAARALRDTPQASHNVYTQQHQMARFLRRFYEGQVVAANDIGAISFAADIRLVDLFGLATQEVAALRLRQQWDAPQIAALARRRGVQIALLYVSWFPIPPQWARVADWRIPDNVVCGDDTVSFFAVDPSAAGPLAEHLREFAGTLPDDVIQRPY